MLAHCTDTSHECQCVCVRCLLLLLQWPTGEKSAAGSRLPVKTSSSPRHNPPSTTTNAPPPPPPTSSSSTSTGGIGSGQDENKVIDTSTTVVVTYTTTPSLTHPVSCTYPLTHSLLFPLPAGAPASSLENHSPSSSSSARSLDLSALRKRLDRLKGSGQQ